jgi:hypothetical protein
MFETFPFAVSAFYGNPSGYDSFSQKNNTEINPDPLTSKVPDPARNTVWN